MVAEVERSPHGDPLEEPAKGSLERPKLTGVPASDDELRSPRTEVKTTYGAAMTSLRSVLEKWP